MILAKIIEEIYFNNLGPSSDTVECGATLVKVLEIDGELLSFANDLPADMRLIDETELTDLSSENELSPLRFRIILTLRYLNARMLLHRSALSCFLEHISMEPVVARTKFQNSINQASLEVCVEVAFTALTIISKAMLREHMLPIWWWSVYFGECPYACAVLCDRSNKKSQLSARPWSSTVHGWFITNAGAAWDHTLLRTSRRLCKWR